MRFQTKEDKMYSNVVEKNLAEDDSTQPLTSILYVV